MQFLRGTRVLEVGGGYGVGRGRGDGGGGGCYGVKMDPLTFKLMCRDHVQYSLR